MSYRNVFAGIAVVIVALFIFGGGGGEKGGSSSHSSAPRAESSAPLPSNGEVLQGDSYGDGIIKVTAPRNQHCVVKVYSADKKAQSAFFVKSGSTASVNVPEGSYFVHFALGESWAGNQSLFGDGTIYGADNSPHAIRSGEGMEYSLKTVSNGNFSMDHIDASQF